MTAQKGEEAKHLEHESKEDKIISNDVKTLISWKAPGRPFRKRGKQFYLTGILIVLLVEIILFLFSQYILMLVVASLLFMAFALSSVPPKDFHYRISTEGIMVEDYFFLWEELYDFYFKTHGHEDTVRIGSRYFFPGEIVLTLRGIDREHIKSILIHYLPFREFVKPSFMEKASEWLEHNFPLEKSPSESIKS